MSVVANIALNVDARDAVSKLRSVDQAAKGLNTGLEGAAGGAKGFGAALSAALGPLLAVSTAVAVVQKGLTTAFERGSAEQRLKNITSSTEEYETALAVAAKSADKFGISQTESTKALADVYSRLKGVGFGLKETTQIYEGFNAIAKQSGLSAEDASGAFFQLSQALGKGKLNGDEFVIIAERMPQLMDAIAKTTGKSRGELQQMASQGKITSEVLYKALATSADAAGDLNAKLTSQQKAFNQLGQVTDKLLNSIGQVFAPFVIKGAEALAWLGNKMADWWGYLGAQVFPKLYEAVKPVIVEMQKIWSGIPWDTILGTIQGITLRLIDGVLGALKLISPVIAYLVQKWGELSSNPVFKFIAEQVGRLAGFLGISNNAVSQFTAKQKEATAATASQVDKFSSMPEKIETAKDRMTEFGGAAQAAVDATTASMAAIERQTQALSLGYSIATAKYEAEAAINNLYGAQLERQYSQAKTAQDRLNIAVRMFEQQVRAARIEYQQSIASIELEQQKLDLQAQQTRIKYSQIQAEGYLQLLQSKSVDEEEKKRGQLDRALAAQIEVINATDTQVKAQREIGVYQKQTAAAQFESKILAAQTGLEQKLISKEVGLSEQRAAGFSGQLAASARLSYNLASGMNATANSAAAVVFQIERATAAQIRFNAARGGSPNAGGAIPIPKFARGGVVNKPTLALVGEGGEREYVVPESKAPAFAANWMMGRRGESTIPSGNAQINVTTGPVMQQGGQQYVSMADLEKAMRKTADGIYASLRTPAGRYAVGVR